MSDEVNQILSLYHSGTLWSMAHAAGLEVMQAGKKIKKDDLLALMRKEYFTEARVRASFAALTERERAVLNRLLLRGESAPTASFRRELIRAKLATAAPELEKPKKGVYRSHPASVLYDPGNYAGDPTRAHSTVFEDIIARLTWRGLVFSRDVPLTSGNVPHKLQFHPGRILYVPEIVRRYLPEPQPVASELEGWQPERVESGEPMLLLRDLYLYWDFLRCNEVSFIQAGYIGKRWLRAINEILVIPDPLVEGANREDETGRLYMLRQLLEACGLARNDAGILRPTLAHPAAIPDFWGRPLAEQVNACVDAWQNLLGGEVELGKEAQRYSPNTRQAQKVVLAVLKSLPRGAWMEIEEILERIQMQNRDFLFPEHSRAETYRGSYYYSYSYGYYSENTKTLLAKFDRFEAEFVTRCLTGFLHQIGFVELGYSGKKLGGVRVSAAIQEENEAGRLIIQPNFQLLAIGPVKLDQLAWLELFADRQRADRGAFEYHIGRESIYRAQQLGVSVAEIVRFLEEHSSTELPQNVRRSLEEWAAHHERIVFRSGVSLLQAADADLLAALMNGNGDAIARAVTPEVALLKKGRQAELVAALVAQGLFPAISGDQPTAADKSIIVEEDGAIRPVHAVPSLHLRGRLARLADETPEGGWRLTPASVRRAGGNRAKVLRMLEELGKLNRGTLPPDLVERLKAWGGYYGQVAAQTLTLLEFRDPAALEELQAHPSLRDDLTPFPAGNRALAVVPTQRLDAVKEILARFGVAVKDGLRDRP